MSRVLDSIELLSCKKEKIITNPRVALLVPAHNEESTIHDTVVSALKQTVRAFPDVQFDIIVIEDNCTDRTGQVVLNLIKKLRSEITPPPVFLLKTEGNKNRKAGALNHAFDKIRKLGYSFIATADADTMWDSNFLKNGLLTMEKEGATLGGICGRVGLLPYRREPFKALPLESYAFWAFVLWFILNCLRFVEWTHRSAWTYLWWSFQNIEYSIGQSETVERMGKAHCLAGPGTIYRAEVLEQVYLRYGQVWPNSLTEDFDLTLKIQMLGYEVRVGHDMFVYTDCPVGFRAHRIQRTRWNVGNLATYMAVGMNRYTFSGGTDMGWQFVWFVCRLNLLITAIQIWVSGFVYIDTLGYVFMISPLVTTTALNILRFKYVAYKSLFQFFLCVCMGYELYALWYGIVLTTAYVKAFTKKVTRWR